MLCHAMLSYQLYTKSRMYCARQAEPNRIQPKFELNQGKKNNRVLLAPAATFVESLHPIRNDMWRKKEHKKERKKKIKRESKGKRITPRQKPTSASRACALIASDLRRWYLPARVTRPSSPPATAIPTISTISTISTIPTENRSHTMHRLLPPRPNPFTCACTDGYKQHHQWRLLANTPFLLPLACIAAPPQHAST